MRRARSLEARKYQARARAAYGKADPAASGQAEARQALENAPSCAHTALNALLRHYRAPHHHDPRVFESFHDVVAVPFQEPL